MGSTPSAAALSCIKLLDLSSETLRKHESLLESSILSRLSSKAPLSTRLLKAFLSTSLSSSQDSLKKSLIKQSPSNYLTIHPYITLLTFRFKSKEPFYTYINSMRSLSSLHTAKIKTLEQCFIKKKLGKKEIFEAFLKRIKGSFACDGIAELDKLVSDASCGNGILTEVFKQTKQTQKALEADIEDVLKSDSHILVPKGFNEIREKLQKKLRKITLIHS